MDPMGVEQLADGLWRWTVPHPEWRPGASWDRIVGCVYCETADAVALIDPLLPNDADHRERFWSALDRDVDRLGLPIAVLVTCRWHVRSAREIAERYPGTRVWAADCDAPGLAGVATDIATDGTEIIPGVVAYQTGAPYPEAEASYWIPGQGALVVGDFLLGDDHSGLRIAPASWFEENDAVRRWYDEHAPCALGRLAALQPSMVLVAHGAPVLDDAAFALQRALGGASG